jgi:ABC-type branched-subunit amino acid transport system substrate-binding protein
VADRRVVRVCLLLPATGESAELGAELRRGMAIAQAEIRGQTWRKLRLEWVEKDTRSTEQGAVSAYHHCYGEDFSVIIGPVHPAATSAIIPIAEAHNAVLIIPEVGGAVPSKWADHMIAVAPPASQMGSVAAADAIGPRQLRKGAVLRPSGVFGESLGSAFEASFQRLGGTIVFSAELDPSKPKAWRAAALEAGIAGAEALFIVGPPEVAAAVVAAMDGPPLAASHSWFIDWAMFPGVLEVASASTRRRIHWVNRNQPMGSFAETYTTRYQAAPLFAAGAGYDSIMLAAYAAEAAGVADPSAIAQAAGNLAGLRGAFGAGAVVQQGGVLSLDSAGYRVFEPRRKPKGEGPIFSAQ